MGAEERRVCVESAGGAEVQTADVCQGKHRREDAELRAHAWSEGSRANFIIRAFLT